jgi:hypothetical protein
MITGGNERGKGVFITICFESDKSTRYIHQWLGISNNVHHGTKSKNIILHILGFEN